MHERGAAGHVRNGIRRLFRLAVRRGDVRRDDVDEELRLHVDLRVDQLMRRGLTEESARAQAMAWFAGDGRTLEDAARGLRASATRRETHMALHEWLGDLRRDMRLAARSLLRAPGFTAVAVLTLALGIGATITIFSVVYGVLLKPLSFHEPDRLVGVYHMNGNDGRSVMNQGPATFFIYRDNQRVLEGLGAWDATQVSVTGRGEPERVRALQVSSGTIPLLRVRPLLGRLFTSEDDAPGAAKRAVLTYGYWQRAFGGASSVIGQSLTVDGTLVEVIGVLPASFSFLRTDPALLLPLEIDPAAAGFMSFGFQVLARLRPGVTVERANADMSRMISLVDQVPGHAALRLQPNVRPLAADVIGNVGRILWILLGTVGIVLAIACVNVANLFLVRAEARGQELSIRAALGASHGRVARALLSETLMLGLAGGAVGLLFAQAGIGVLRRLAPATLPRVDEIGIDLVVVLLTLAISLLTGVLFGLMPVLKFGKPSIAALKEGGRAGSSGPARQRTRNSLVIAEVAMAFVLLITSGLMVRTFMALRDVQPGFVRPEEVQTFRIDVPPSVAADSSRLALTHQQIAERLRQVPGVVSVGLSSHVTMDGEDNTNAVYVEHVDALDAEQPPMRRYKSIAPGYFETMGNRMVAGRTIDWTDIQQIRPVAVVSEALARQYWPRASDALGKRIKGNGPTWFEIVGVSGDERDEGLSKPATAIVYWPLLSENYMQREMAYVVRSARVGAPGFLGELRRAVWSQNPSLPLASVQTLEEIQGDSMAQTSFIMVMLALAASVALLLSVVGIYGVITYVATQRTREMGIRLALGAQAGDVRRLVLNHGVVLCGVGIALGVGVSLGLDRVMSSLLFGVRATDPITYVVMSAGLAAIALLATWIPAHRVSRVDPILALRADS